MSINNMNKIHFNVIILKSFLCNVEIEKSILFSFSILLWKTVFGVRVSPHSIHKYYFFMSLSVFKNTPSTISASVPQGRGACFLFKIKS